MSKQISTRHTLAYGSANLLGSGALAISGAWLMYFYTTFCGLSVVEAATIFSIASIIDAISNPVMGYITDNFYNTRLGRIFGRRRFFILLGIPLVLVYPMLWMSGFGFWYYLLTYALFELIYTSIMVPYETLATEMTTDFAKRSKLTGSKAIFGKVANFLAAFIPGQFIAIYGKDSATPFLYTGIAYGLIMCCAMIWLYSSSWERPASEVVRETTSSLGQALKKLCVDMASTFHLRIFRKHLGMYLFGFGAEWLFASAFTYFIIFGLGQDAALVSQLNSFSSIMQLISTAIFIGICVKMGFARPFRIALQVVIVSVVAYAALYFTGWSETTTVIVLFCITAVFGLSTGGIYYIPWTVYTFLADVDEVLTGRRREGIYAGAMTFAGKMVRSIIVFAMGWTLSRFGFVSGQSSQPEIAVQAIVGVFAIGVISLALVAIYYTTQMKLDRKNHSILLEEIERIKNGGAMADIPAHARAVAEELTGWKYEQCWGNNPLGVKESPTVIPKPVTES
ncbi:MFS transporter [Yersinia pestis]|nr:MULTISPECIES: MFS transporter [Yersinia pseudotuberculosis complex]EDR34529.1 putative transport protein [Yersinia pestis biovar Orientalis str. IP275]EFA46428.1 putative membrane protein [Yersinia pestis KIM D27]ERP75728.1 major facilitator transporter [Yersinia pestis S3]ERP76395.1 major facilitator transporter [Yersinia pestis 24H]ABG12909.1 putative transport protein [Yersinia pestis Antiqua]